MIGSFVLMCQRGSLKLFDDFFSEAPVEEKPLLRSIGRDSERHARRNTLLLHRYYWHGRRTIEGLRPSYVSILAKLDIEFALSPSTIAQTIDKCYEELLTIKQRYAAFSDKAVSHALQKEYPFMVW